jgi:molybdopterin converting factor subunit 1
MKVTILLFARAKELAGKGELDLELPEGTTVAALREELCRQFPKLTDVARRSVFAVNEEYASDSQVIGDGNVVACIPPVSGGSF